MLDITLTGDKINFRFDPTFFDEDFRRLTYLSHKEYGSFKSGILLGFGDRTKLVAENKKTILYQWTFAPLIQDGGLFRPAKLEICQLYATIEYLFQYTFINRFTVPSSVPAQSFSLYPVEKWADGWLYPPLLNFLKYCPDALLKSLNEHVNKEINRVSSYVWGQNNFLSARIYHASFNIKIIDSSDRYFWMGDRMYKGMCGFENHNADNPLDRFCLLTGIIALNTFFRENENL